MSRMFLNVVATAAALALPGAAAWAGPVQLVSQSRTASVKVVSEAFGDEVPEVVQDSAAADGFGLFTADLDARIPAADDGGSPSDSYSTLKLTSDVRDDGFDAAGEGGSYNRQGAGMSSSQDLFSVVFDVTAPVRFDAAFSYSSNRPGPTRVSLAAGEGDDAALVFDEDVWGEEHEVEGEPYKWAFDVSHVLAPGRYTFSSEFGLPGDDEGRSFEYAFGVDLTPASGGGPTPVPLPAAAWAGLSLMGAMGATRLVRRRGTARA